MFLPSNLKLVLIRCNIFQQHGKKRHSDRKEITAALWDHITKFEKKLHKRDGNVEQVQPALRGRIKNVQKMGRKKDSNRERVEAALDGQIELDIKLREAENYETP
jgi:hypothetical protein